MRQIPVCDGYCVRRVVLPAEVELASTSTPPTPPASLVARSRHRSPHCAIHAGHSSHVHTGWAQQKRCSWMLMAPVGVHWRALTPAEKGRHEGSHAVYGQIDRSHSWTDPHQGLCGICEEPFFVAPPSSPRPANKGRRSTRLRHRAPPSRPSPAMANPRDVEDETERAGGSRSSRPATPVVDAEAGGPSERATPMTKPRPGGRKRAPEGRQSGARTKGVWNPLTGSMLVGTRLFEMPAPSEERQGRSVVRVR